jgi:arylsulfatase A-like enzyme
VPEAYRRVRGLPTALPTPESFNEADVSDKAPEIRQPPLSGRQIRTEKVAYAKRVKATHAADALVVGRLLDVLEATGQLDETYVFFVADNGMLEGRHRLSTKGMPYEEAHQVPFAVAGPGVRQGISRDLAANIDLAPTFLDIAGAPEREHFDGESLLPAMLGTGGLDRDYLLYEGWWPYGYRAVRTADGFAYIRYNRSGTEEVYDLAADRYQLYGTASEQEAARLPELSAKTDDLFPCAGEECRTTDNGP